MKTVKVKYLLHSQASIKKGEVYERFLVENEFDLKKLLANGIITKLHLTGIRKYIESGEKVIVNENGGYCNMKDTWEFATEAKEKRYLIKWEIDEFASSPLEAIRKAIAAMPVDGNNDTLATVFDVLELDENGKTVNKVQIDLLDEEEQDEFEKELDEEELNKTMDKIRDENF